MITTELTSVCDEVVDACAPWSAIVRADQTLQIIDLHGNQAVDTLLYGVSGNQVDHTLRYSAQSTVAAQRNIFLSTGSVLRAANGTPLMTIVADDVGNHDTIAGACSKESNTLRYGHHTLHQHACAENFLAEGAKWGLGKRDIVSNINFFMNVPVEADGTLGIVDGLSAPGKSLTLRAERDTLVLVSNCPQINNPCNGFDPTPVRMVISAAMTADRGGAAGDADHRAGLARPHRVLACRRAAVRADGRPVVPRSATGCWAIRRSAAGLECTRGGPAFAFPRRRTRVRHRRAGGGDAGRRAGAAVAVDHVPAGGVLDVATLTGPGMRCYVLVAGGLEEPEYLRQHSHIHPRRVRRPRRPAAA